MAELVLELFEVSVMSLAVKVEEPAVSGVTSSVIVPPASAVFAGRTAFASEEVRPTTWLTFATGFQLASTAFTITLKEDAAVCAAEDPTFPETVPGAAVSPGARICNFENTPALTVSGELALLLFAAFEMSPAVSVALPAVLKVTLMVFVPLSSAALAGSVVLLSDELIPIVSVAVFATL